MIAAQVQGIRRWLRALVGCGVCVAGVGLAHAGTIAPSFDRHATAERMSKPAAPAKLNTYQRDLLRRYVAGRPAGLDTLRVLAVPVQFSDSLMGGQPGSLRQEVRDSIYFANELTHLTQYFDGASRGRFALMWTLAPRLYNLPETMGFYGDDALQDTRVVDMMRSVIDSADADVDFSRYDTVMLIHAGAGQETDLLGNSREQLFSTFLDRGDIDEAFADSSVAGLLTADSLGGEPFLVDNFMALPASSSQDGRTIGTLGIWAFMAASRLGLVPMFDSTPSGFADSRGIGDFGLMSTGLFNAIGFVPAFPCVFNRILGGWIDPLTVDAGGAFRLHDINTPSPDDTVCLRIPITESEYFLVVNRVHDTNLDSLFTFTDLDSDLVPDNTDSFAGAEFDWWLTDITNPFIVKPDPNFGGKLRRFVVTGSGLHIWHVDESVVVQNIDAGFLPNDFVSRKGVDLEEADGVPDLDNSGSDFSFGSHFDTFRAGNNTTFGPETNPSTESNAGARTGVRITDISAPDSFMTCTVEFLRPYSETRTRWGARGEFQPPAAFDLDGNAGEELVVFADSGRVYAFTPLGAEFVDADNDPATIAPYLTAPGAEWRGAPAFGDIDGGGDREIVACSESGDVYAWKGNGTEVFDGDGDPATVGVLYPGLPLAAPPMLVDVDGDLVDEVAIVEQVGDSLEVGFINGGGARVAPSLSGFAAPRVQAQYAAPVAWGFGRGNAPGLVLAWADTIRSVYGLTLFGFGLPGQGTETLTFAPRGGTLERVFPPTSAPAVGDLNGDGEDEVVLTLPDGRLVIHTSAFRDIFVRKWAAAPGPDPGAPAQPVRSMVVDLRADRPSSPALGDVDDDGTLEIALWDSEYFYVFEYNGRLATNWPRPLVEILTGNLPALSFDARLNSPLIGHVDADNRVDLLFPTREGTIYGFHGDASVLDGFPRPAPAAGGATGMVDDLDGDGELSLISLSSVPLVTTFDSVSDTIIAPERLVLAIQSLPGSSDSTGGFWLMYRQNGERQGRVTGTGSPVGSPPGADGRTFVVYPNPVRGREVRARIVLNQAATINVEIFNLEGERAASQGFRANPAGVIQTPFDEAIDVSRLESGVYMLRLRVETSSGTDAFVKTFAILR